MKAKMVCKSVEIMCGHCGETISEPSTGSVFWVLTEIKKNTTIKCDTCGKENKLDMPARVRTSL